MPVIAATAFLVELDPMPAKVVFDKIKAWPVLSFFIPVDLSKTAVD